jgi:hypothetical protein
MFIYPSDTYDVAAVLARASAGSPGLRQARRADAPAEVIKKGTRFCVLRAIS